MGLKNEYDVDSKFTVNPDLEKQQPLYGGDDAAVPNIAFTEGDSTYATLQRFAGKFSIEQRGIERVPENERTDKSMANVGTLVRLHFLIPVGELLMKKMSSGCRPTWSSPLLLLASWQ